MSAPKRENGFVGQENCFVAWSRRNNLGEKFNDLSHMKQRSGAYPEHGSRPKPKVAPCECRRSLDQPRSFIGPPADSNRVQPFWQSRVMARLQQRMAVVGNGIIDVGNQTPSRNPSQPVTEPLAQSDRSSELRIDKPLQTGTISICGAMPLQRGDSGRGNESVPQKLVHLVGCRDPNVRPELSVRPQSFPTKQ